MPTDLPVLPRSKPAYAFWILALLLVVYVAACTGERENKSGADAWEHLRVVHALTENLWHPGNPTYASDLPSVRYSPYMVTLAWICRATGIAPYAALGAAATVNTALLAIALWTLLGAFDERASAASVLLIMVALWGVAPAYANSYALSDLPWHQVNPSAFSFALVLFTWSLLRYLGTAPWTPRTHIPRILACVLLVCDALLDHGMTGVFGVMGLFIVALTVPAPSRIRTLVIVAVITLFAGLLCLTWPWYSFLQAVTTHQDADYWFNPFISKLTFTVWCAPAFLCILFAIPLRNRPLVRTCMLGGAASVLVGLAAIPMHSAVFARFPLPGMVFFHIAIGIFAHEAGIFRIATWPRRLRELTSLSASAAYPILQTALAAMFVYFLIPQLISIAIEPHLGRRYLTSVLHLRNLQTDPLHTYADLLAPIGPHDVVLSDPETSWTIPAIRGRIVAAIHYELFMPGQTARLQAVDDFFARGDSNADRRQTLLKYHVRWILLNPEIIGDDVSRSLFDKDAIVKRYGSLVLMNANAWINDPANQTSAKSTP